VLNEPKLIGRPDTPAGLKTTPGRRRQLPPDLLRQASRRLQILALIGAALWFLGPSMGHLAAYLTSPEDARWAQLGATDAIAAIAFLVSLGLYAYLRIREHDPAFVMNLALVYMVACAAGIALMFHLGPPGGSSLDTQPMISWIGPIILMFAALTPGSPWKLLAAGFLAVSMDPVGMVIAQAAGRYHFGQFHQALLMHYPSYLLLGVAVVISHVVTRLGRQVARERELGSYRLGELLGRGGMGEVYKATHRMLARPAAIKLIQPQVLATRDRASAQVAVARFRREAEAAAKLRSPHTVELYDFGVTEDGGALYLVMEFLEGMDLESLVRSEGPLPQKRVIHILRQICESLEEAHAAGLVHRDIKPANIHVGRVGLRHDFVKVLDFGLVKSVGDAPADDSMATAAGLTPGTPAYMAPEMALGESVDGRADLYALGCVAYYLLTGHLVFEAASGFQVIAKHIHDTPVPPSQRTELDIAPALDRMVLACLAKRPEDRPESATEVDRMLAEIEVEPWSEAEATQWWRTHQPA
jgi:eukaryotic-like serine/threonine-protein kinase